MKKVVKLDEEQLTNIIKKVINENRGRVSLETERDNLRHLSQRLLRYIDEYTMLMKKGEYKKMGDELDNIRKMSKKLKEVLQQIDSKI